MGTVQPSSVTMKQRLPSLFALIGRHRLLLLVVLTAFALDQGTKYAVSHTMALGQSAPAHGFFRITYVYNTGSVFGLFTSQNTLLTIGSFVGIGVLIWFYRSYSSAGPLLRLSLGLQMAGALGNVTDRLILGRVTDFIDVGAWPIFNLADSSIVVGVALLVWVFMATPAARKEDVPLEEAAAGPREQVAPDDRSGQ